MTEYQPLPDQFIDLATTFDDGSIFTMPDDWHDAFVDYFGHNPDNYPAVAQRLEFITDKYYQHQAWPSKFDGMLAQEEQPDYDPASDARYDLDSYYAEHWGDPPRWQQQGRRWRDGYIGNPPMMSQIAEAVLYQNLRPLLMQKALQRLGSHAVVMTPQQAIREITGQ